MIKARITDVRTVAVPVADQGAAVGFYVDTLGFEKRLDASVDQLGGRWIEVAPSGGTTTLALVTAGGAPGGDTGIRLTATDPAALHADLLARGVDVDDLLRWDGVPAMSVFRDRDGNRLVIVESR